MIRATAATQNQTLARLIKAMDNQNAVTITALKEHKDTSGKRTGHLVETVRTIEIYDVTVSQAGDILIKAMDRETQQARTFRLDRITAYTVHRSHYTVERIEDDTETVPAPSLRHPGFDELELVGLDTAARINLLADCLAA